MHDVAYGTVSDVAPHFRNARPSHSDDPSKVSGLIGLDTLSTA
jgi:hypothetical protein